MQLYNLRGDHLGLVLKAQIQQHIVHDSYGDSKNDPLRKVDGKSARLAG